MYNGVSRGAQITGVAVCSLALTWISFAFRIYVRMGILKFLGREDWITVAAMVLDRMGLMLEVVLTTADHFLNLLLTVSSSNGLWSGCTYEQYIPRLA